MAVLKFDIKKGPSNSTSDVMDAEMVEITESRSNSLLEVSKSAVRNMGLRMTEVPCPCSARRQGRPPMAHKENNSIATMQKNNQVFNCILN